MKYLIIRRSEKRELGYTVTLCNDVIAKQLKTAAWMVLVGNGVADAKRALALYRDKDVTEKGFLRLKNSFDLGRIRMYSLETMHNKTFVGFLSLILLSSIHRKMVQEDLYAKMTMRQLVLTLSKLRVQEINGVRIQFLITKQQRDIFSAFGISEPT